MARYLCAVLLGVDEVEQMAFLARMGAVWVSVIDTGQGVLECRLWLPRGVDRTTVSALLNEIEFFFEQFEDVAIVISHLSNLQFSLAQPRQLPPRLLIQSISVSSHSECKAHAESHSHQTCSKVRVQLNRLGKLTQTLAQKCTGLEYLYLTRI